MKRILIIAIALSLIACAKRLRVAVAPTGLDVQVNSKTPKEIFKKWVASYEEDKDGIKTFRDSTFKFPPSRFRPKMQFFDNGKFIEYGAGPSDKPEKHEGQWIYSAKTQTFDITFNKVALHPLPEFSEEKKPYSLTIVSLDKGVLKVKRTVSALPAENPENK